MNNKLTGGLRMDDDQTFTKKQRFLQAVKDFFSRALDVNGRTNRVDYGWTILFLVTIVAFFMLLSLALLLSMLGYSKLTVVVNLVWIVSSVFLLFLATLILVPFLSLLLRRLRDVGLRGRGTLVLMLLWLGSNFLYYYVVIKPLYAIYQSPLSTSFVDPIYAFLGFVFFSSLVFLVVPFFPANALTIRKPNTLLRFFLRSR